MALIESVLRRVPSPLRSLLIKHRELLKFAVVGGVAFLVTFVINYSLKLTVLERKPVTAMAIATICATIVSYVLSREWSFRTRGGRERHHEALLFFLVNAAAIGVNLVPEVISRYMFGLEVPEVSRLVQESADFISEMIIGTLFGTVVRFVGYKYLVFPHADARERRPGRKVSPLRPGDEKHIPSSSGDDHTTLAG